MKTRFQINEKGFWETNSNIGHKYDSSLSKGIINFLKTNNIKSLIDFGCGMADYVKEISKESISCEAYDGNPHTERLTNGLAKVLDLSNPFNLNKTVDCVLSLEVGEHIPKKYEQTFINNICNHSHNLIILSWAIIGQKGDGHVNCQTNNYIISEFQKRSFVHQQSQSSLLRNTVSHAFWFKNTLLIFKKN